VIIGILIDRDDQLWCSLWGMGLGQVDLKTRKLRSLHLEELRRRHHRRFGDLDGNIWVSTFGSGLFVFKPQAGKYAQTRHFTDKKMGSRAIKSGQSSN
jgi:sugar lactone lactonase YvrE